MSFLEREIGKVFKAELEKNEYLLSDNVNRQQYFTRFKVYLNKRVPTNGQDFELQKDKSLPPNYIPPPQPEIDMILVDNRNKWHAIELKAIKRTERGMYPSYYFGLGQTLANRVRVSTLARERINVHAVVSEFKRERLTLYSAPSHQYLRRTRYGSQFGNVENP